MKSSSAWIVGALVMLAPSAAFAVTAQDGPFSIELEPKHGRVCVAVPHVDAGAGCNAEALAQVEQATVAGLSKDTTLSFLARVVSDDAEPWDMTFVLASFAGSPELSASDLDEMRKLTPARTGATSVTVTERRLKGTQLVEMSASIPNADGTVDRMDVFTLVASKHTYVITVIGPESHAAEVETLANDALATADGFHAGTTQSDANTTRMIENVAKVVGASGFVLMWIIWGVIRAIKSSKNPPMPPMPPPRY